MGKTLFILAIIYFVFRFGSAVFKLFVKTMAAAGSGPINGSTNSRTNTTNTSTTNTTEKKGFEGGEYIDYEEIKD